MVQRRDMKVRRIPEQHARHRDRGCGSAKRRNRDARLEAAHQLFQDENGAGDRRVERGRKARARARRQEHSAVRPVAAEHLPDQSADNGQKALALLAVRFDQSVPQAVRLIEREAKDGPDQSRGGAGDQQKKREYEKIAGAVGGAGRDVPLPTMAP